MHDSQLAYCCGSYKLLLAVRACDTHRSVTHLHEVIKKKPVQVIPTLQ
jgi:hypothetical protein